MSAARCRLRITMTNDDMLIRTMRHTTSQINGRCGLFARMWLCNVRRNMPNSLAEPNKKRILACITKRSDVPFSVCAASCRCSDSQATSNQFSQAFPCQQTPFARKYARRVLHSRAVPFVGCWLLACGPAHSHTRCGGRLVHKCLFAFVISG